jgi:7-cyano-7-deazaguanine synthase
VVKSANRKAGADDAMLNAIVLLSGGIDSSVTLAIAKQKFTPLALTFDYGQRHSIEINAAFEIAQKMYVQHRVMKLDFRQIGGSALTDDIDVPKNSLKPGIPITYVPARNTIFLSYALALGERLGINDIFIGINAIDYSGYPDCRPEYIEAFEKMSNLGTKSGRFKIHTPIINMSKTEIVKTGLELGVNINRTHSCYDPHSNGEPCGECDSCLIRNKALREAVCSQQ